MNTSYYEEKYIEHLKKREEELNKLPVPKADREAYLLYFEAGNRLEYEKIYFSRREYLTVFGMASVLFEDRKPDKIFEIIEDVLNESTWVLPAHGSREHIEGKKQSIDLFAAETAGALAEIIYFIMNKRDIYDKKMREESKDSINNYSIAQYISICMHFFKEVKKRIFDIFLFKCPCDWWENTGMNWSAVCSGNVGIAAYYVKKLQDLLNGSLIISDADYNEIMNRVTDSMDCYLRSMGKDGACSEGVGYYKYGMEYFLKFYEILRAENRQENINKIGDFHNTALFLQRVYLGGGNSVNFSDCLLKNKMKIGMLCMLSGIYDDVKINEDFADEASIKFDTELMEILGGEECHRWLGAYSDYIWVKTYGEGLKRENHNNNYVREKDESYIIFKDMQWYIKKWDKNTCFYIKGGHNDESHNHNDVGSFGYISEGEEILCDLGLGEYTKDYFGEGRYDILCNSSKGHNVPVIDGRYQRAGKEYHADKFWGNENSIIVSFGMAYDIDKSYTVERKIVFKDKGSLFICDHIEGADKISERLITRIKPEIKGNTVVLNSGKNKINIDFLCRFQTEDDEAEAADSINVNIGIIEETHINHSGKKEKVYIICSDYMCDEDFGNKSGKKKDVVIKLFNNSYLDF